MQITQLQFTPDRQSVPKFFARLTDLALKYRAVGGTISEEDLAAEAATALMAHGHLRDFVSGVLDSVKTPQELEVKVIHHLALTKTAREKRTD